MNKFEVVCEKDGCDNNGINIEILNPDEHPYVICGVCGNNITNIKFIKTIEQG